MLNTNMLNFERKWQSIEELNYWTKYLKEDIKYTRERRFYHYYNDIPYTRWPFYMCVNLFFLIFYGLLYINKYIWAGPLTIIAGILLVFYFFSWMDDMTTESFVFGKYNRKLRSVIVFGFVLFLVSEVLLFAGFFWAFFDRFFHPSAITGGNSMPMGLEILIWYKKPLYGTVVLLFSAIAFNGASYCMKWGSWTVAVLYSYLGLFLGYLFYVIQINEYRHLSFGISDSVYAGSFYLLTGFHGFHVVIGITFLVYQVMRLINWEFTRERHLGFSLAMVYWNFVDIVWIFLFFALYVFNNGGVAYYTTGLSY